MNGFTLSNKMLERYFNVLSHLDNTSKKALIAKLNQSMEKEETREGNIKHLFGAWQDKRSSDEIVKDIQNSRVNSKNIEPF